MSSKNILMFAAVASLLACGQGASESDDADDAGDTSGSTSSESALLSSAGEDTVGMSASMTDAQIADSASVKLKGRFNSGCVTVAGTWSTSWNGAKSGSNSTEVSGLKKCSSSCAAAGGVIKHTGALGKIVTVSLDGSSTAAWSTSAGKSGTIDLGCK